MALLHIVMYSTSYHLYDQRDIPVATWDEAAGEWVADQGIAEEDIIWNGFA